MTVRYETIVLGGGVSGLAAAVAAGCPVFEAQQRPGGICASYYMRPGGTKRLSVAPEGGGAYRFEYGGGHWIFGGESTVLRFINLLAPVKTYTRKSAVYFPERDLYVPYPLQYHVSCLGKEIAEKALLEMITAPRVVPVTMAEWLEQNMGRTMTELFFGPFHELYTAGLWRRIAPQDAYKSPSDLSLIVRSLVGEPTPVGYNVRFVYPIGGLNVLVEAMASRCDIYFEKEAVGIDLKARAVEFADGCRVHYERLVSTVPLNRMCELTGLTPGVDSDPYTSVLVINIGAIRGPRCPDYHWVYVPASRTGFHRVGFYNNVDEDFLPQCPGTTGARVSIYVEKAYMGGARPDDDEVASVCQGVIQELVEWGFVSESEVIDPTWVDVAYTWSWPSSTRQQQALSRLQEHEVYQVGRYGRWQFQGIADSIRDGLLAGTVFRK